MNKRQYIFPKLLSITHQDIKYKESTLLNDVMMILYCIHQLIITTICIL